MPSTDVSRAPRPSSQIVRPRDAASEALALGLLRYGPETVGIVLFGVASILLAALSVVVLGSPAWIAGAGAGGLTAGQIWRVRQRVRGRDSSSR